MSRRPPVGSGQAEDPSSAASSSSLSVQPARLLSVRVRILRARQDNRAPVRPRIQSRNRPTGSFPRDRQITPVLLARQPPGSARRHHGWIPRTRSRTAAARRSRLSPGSDFSGTRAHLDVHATQSHRHRGASPRSVGGVYAGPVVEIAAGRDFPCSECDAPVGHRELYPPGVPRAPGRNAEHRRRRLDRSWRYISNGDRTGDREVTQLEFAREVEALRGEGARKLLALYCGSCELVYCFDEGRVVGRAARLVRHLPTAPWARHRHGVRDR